MTRQGTNRSLKWPGLLTPASQMFESIVVLLPAVLAITGALILVVLSSIRSWLSG